MKLAKISHKRCDEYDATTYLLVPGELTQDELDSACDRAEDAYLKDAQAFRELAQETPDPGFFNADKYPPDWTIKRAKADWQKKKDAYDERQKIRASARRPFGSYLSAEIPGSQDLWECEFESSVSWGHRHGMGPILYGSDPTQKDLKGVAAPVQHRKV